MFFVEINPIFLIFQDYLVEENLLNIELKRLKSILHNSSEINSNLEQQQIQIQKVFSQITPIQCDDDKLRYDGNRQKGKMSKEKNIERDKCK